jgi:hypothetical protein
MSIEGRGLKVESMVPWPPPPSTIYPLTATFILLFASVFAPSGLRVRFFISSFHSGASDKLSISFDSLVTNPGNSGGLVRFASKRNAAVR